LGYGLTMENLISYIVTMANGEYLQFWAEDKQHAIEQANDGYGSIAVKVDLATEFYKM
jgi:hypothetical protein